MCTFSVSDHICWTILTLLHSKKRSCHCYKWCTKSFLQKFVVFVNEKRIIIFDVQHVIANAMICMCPHVITTSASTTMVDDIQSWCDSHYVNHSFNKMHTFSIKWNNFFYTGNKITQKPENFAGGATPYQKKSQSVSWLRRAS